MSPDPAWPAEWLRGVPPFLRGLPEPPPCTGSRIHDGGTPAQQRDACAICATCPVRQACRDWALDHPTEAGTAVWGGLTQDDRKTVRRRRPRR
ncbi:WhiB family transcriptional regulator [Streptomyces sp. NBRC 109706]|uniref:WhiB family transcriptional regulator n=1 Tax=Streptomyces sp. NBRC 109706 TaxID=1550035 RepID=UPI00099C525D